MATINVRIKRQYARICLSTDKLTVNEAYNIIKELDKIYKEPESIVSLLLSKTTINKEQCSERTFSFSEPIPDADFDISFPTYGMELTTNKRKTP